MANKEFKRTFSNAPWESKVGYCRALRAGNQIYVTGTAPVDDDGSIFKPGDPYAQKQDICLMSSTTSLNGKELGIE